MSASTYDLLSINNRPWWCYFQAGIHYWLLIIPIIRPRLVNFIEVFSCYCNHRQLRILFALRSFEFDQITSNLTQQLPWNGQTRLGSWMHASNSMCSKRLYADHGHLMKLNTVFGVWCFRLLTATIWLSIDSIRISLLFHCHVCSGYISFEAYNTWSNLSPQTHCLPAGWQVDTPAPPIILCAFFCVGLEIWDSATETREETNGVSQWERSTSGGDCLQAQLAVRVERSEMFDPSLIKVAKVTSSNMNS